MGPSDSSLLRNEEAIQLVGQSFKMQQVMRIIEQVAQTDIPVLICGESGSGKEIVARLIHFHSLRRLRPFLKVSCAAIPQDLLESELMGFERGSFTGAYQSKPGKFELANTGTIYLDEISEMTLLAQPKLLEVLQDNQFSRLGAQREVVVDVRIISSSQRPLDKLAEEGKFREDLYYRLSVVTIQLPPLRERKEDIPELARHLVKKHALEMKREEVELSDSIIDSFMQYDWPGNVRELENVVRNLLVTVDRTVVLDSISRRAGEKPGDCPGVATEQYSFMSLKEAARLAARKAEREMILLALKKTNWNRKRAAELLQISYKAMLYKLKDAGLAKHARTVYSA